ncbi:hypothetical protein [Pseudomonas sp.]|uniref:hypothetical protein n=1 Tax=Pseudomonas sp. TaxID=306 RepID=UPI003D6E5C65
MGTLTEAGEHGLELSEEELKALANRKLAEHNNSVIKKRNGKSPLGKAVSGLAMLRSPAADLLADEFTFEGTLPTITPARPNTPPFAAYSDEDGSGNDLVYLSIPQWADTDGPDDGSDSEDIVSIYIGGQAWPYTLPGEQRFSLPYPPDAGSFPVKVPLLPSMLASLGDGIHLIGYSVQNSLVENEDESLAQQMYVDTRPPSRNVPPAAIGVPAGLITPPPGQPLVISAEYLASNDPVSFPVPVYSDPQLADEIIVRDENSNTVLIRAPIWPVGQPARSPNIDIPAATIQALGNGPKQIVYELIDYAQNLSGTSVARPIVLELVPAPINLQAPDVNPNPVNRAGATAGVAINATYDNARPDDLVEFTWETPNGNKTVGPVRYDALPGRIGWPELSDPDSGAVYSARVTYTVRRGTANTAPSPANNVPVDLSVVGPVNPNDPDPVNPDLIAVTVTGGVSGQPDVINHLDFGVDGSIRFTVYDGAVAGHVVTFFYNGAELNPPLVLDAGHVPGSIVPVPLPWATILLHGNGTIPVYYTIKEAANSANFQQSVNTPVRVTAITQAITNFVNYNYLALDRQDKRPGTPAAQTGIINCRANPWDGVNLSIRFAPGEFIVNDVVTLHWVFCTDILGQVEVANTRYEAPVTVSQAHVTAGSIVISVPYEATRFGEGTVGGNPPLPGLPHAVSGSFSCQLIRARGAAIGLSAKSIARYNTTQGGRVCQSWPTTP